MSEIMKRLAIAALALMLAIGAFVWKPHAFRAAGNFFAMLTFPERVTPDSLLEKRARGDPIRVLVVPGHDGDYWGTDYRGVREADLTAELGRMVRDRFAADPRFTVAITREGTVYTDEFSEYFKTHSSLIWEFRDYVRTTFFAALARGDVKRRAQNFHGKAISEIARRLYGINMWANEHETDVALHLHFNDYPRPRQTQPGRYRGWAIYVPESQFPNARASRTLAETLAARLLTFSSVSNLSQESAGVVEDQELIAVGSHASLYAASMVIEYGYIYEPWLVDAEARAEAFPRLADLTYRGIADYFES